VTEPLKLGTVVDIDGGGRFTIVEVIAEPGERVAFLDGSRYKSPEGILVELGAYKVKGVWPIMSREAQVYDWVPPPGFECWRVVGGGA
jgi:hypothetical protein